MMAFEKIPNSESCTFCLLEFKTLLILKMDFQAGIKGSSI